MTGWLIYSKEDAKKNEAYIGLYIDEGKKRGIEIILIYSEVLEFGVKNGEYYTAYKGKTISKPDFAISRTIYPLLTRHLECMGIPVFNNSQIADICNDKARTYQFVAKLGIPVIDTTFVKKKELKKYLKSITKPTVVKAVDGHGGSQVFLLETKDLANEVIVEEIIYKMGGSDCVLQPLTGNKNSDLRVYVIGKEVIAAVVRTANNGFRSNYSLGGRVSLYTLSVEEKVIVDQIIHLFDFGMAGIDFLIGDNGELIFNEIEDVVGARMLYACSNINLVGLYLDFIKRQLL